MNKLKIVLLIIKIWIFFPSISAAIELDRAYIESFVKSFVEKNTTIPEQGKIYINVSKIDPRIMIKPCQLPLSANIPEKRNSRNVNVKISCLDSTSWHMYVPVKIRTMVPVLVATTGISKGSTLEKSNISLQYKELGKIRGEILDSVDSAAGAKSKRTISKGTPITRRNICLVCKGDQVIITAQSSSFSIKTTGFALKDGGLGDQVSIKNSRSGRTVLGRVSAINKVVINL